MSKMLPTAAGVLSLLWDKLDKKAASDEELDFLADASEEASCMARGLSETVSAVACSISDDQRTGGKSGALEGDQLPILLFNISRALETIAELSFIGHESSYLLKERSEQRICAKAETTANAVVHSASSDQRKECTLDQV